MALRRKKEDQLRRSTDISPRASMPTYTYHNVRGNEDRKSSNRNLKEVSTKQLRKARNVWIDKFGLIVLAVVIIICLFSVLYLSSNPNVIMLNNDTDPLFTNSKAAVGNEARKLLSSSFLNSNKITVNTDKITQTLEKDYPMYSDISIGLPLIDHHPVIYLTPAQPEINLTNSNGEYILNSNGQVMLRSMSLKTYNYLDLPQITYQASGYMPIGQQVLTNNEIAFVKTVIYELNTRGDKVSKMSLPQLSSELDVYITNKPYYVKFNLQNNDPRQQVGSFLATQHYLQSQNITPTQYIDVRVDGRVYYQ